MTAVVTRRFHDLAGTLEELKTKVRTALATELATAVGTAVRDVLVVALIDRLIVTPPRTTSRTPPRTPGGWRTDDDEGRWSDDYDVRREPTRTPDEAGERDEEERVPAIPVATAIAVGVHVGRWWLARHGTVSAAVGVGVLATALGFAGGPVARAALAVLAAATDLLTAESALSRLDHS